MSKKKGEPDLSQWYKPTKEGAEARRHLLETASDIPPSRDDLINMGLEPLGQAGAVGEEVDNVEPTKSNRKKGKSKNEGRSKK